MALKHSFVNAKADGGDATRVRPSDWNADHVIDKDGMTLETGSPSPSVPAAGKLVVWAKNRGGRILPNFIGPSGLDTSFQPALFGNSIIQWLPTTGTTLYVGGGVTYTARNAGTSAAQAHPALANTNDITRLRRATFGTGTTTTGSSGIQTAATVCFRGDAAGRGGFYYVTRFGVETFASDIRLFNGLSANNAAIAADPSTWNNTCGICKDTADSTWQIVMRGTSVTKTDTGLTVTAGQVLDFFMFAVPNDSKITCRLVDPVTGTVYVDNVEFSTNLPASTTFLYMQAHIQSLTGTTAKLLALSKMYLETDI